MVKLVMGHPLAHVGLEHLRREVDDAVHVAVGQRADRTIGHEATDEGAVFTVKPLSTGCQMRSTQMVSSSLRLRLVGPSVGRVLLHAS